MQDACPTAEAQYGLDRLPLAKLYFEVDQFAVAHHPQCDLVARLMRADFLRQRFEVGNGLTSRIFE